MFDAQIEYDANFDSNQAKGNQTQTIDAHGGWTNWQKNLNFQDRLDILLKMRLSDVAE